MLICLFKILNFLIPDIYSQQINYPLEFYHTQLINERINRSDKIIHTGFRPLQISKLRAVKISDSLFYQNAHDININDRIKSKWIYRKLRREDFIILNTENLSFKINPLFNFEWQKEKNDNQEYFINTRGIEFKGDIGKQLSFYSSFYENQAGYVPYISQNIRKTLVVPGQGAAKFIENGKFDFSRAEAYLSFSIKEFFNLQFGHSKHFIGDGYRSLLLSDNAFNYPFIKMSLSWNKFQYIILWSQYQSFTGAYYNYHQRKYSSISYLSWIPKPGIEFSIIESIIWPGNTPDKKSNLNLNFFNPLILSRTIQYGLNNEKNILLGFNTQVKIYKYARFFIQFALDKTDNNIKAQNNYAFQVGFKHFDLFHGKLPNHSFYFHSEFNYIAPYTYTWNNSKQSFSHYNQSLMHPSGTGLKETFATLKYQFKDLSFILRTNYIINSSDTLSTNFGSDIFKGNDPVDGIISNIGNEPGQGVRNELLFFTGETAFLINKATNMQLFFGLHLRRNLNLPGQKENLYFSFGIKTNLNNYYYDF